MGNKEAKFKQTFEEIDTSGDKKVSFTELANYVNPINNEKVGEVFFEEFTEEELKEFSQELITLGENNDGKLSFEEFLEAINDNETMKKFIDRCQMPNQMKAMQNDYLFRIM